MSQPPFQSNQELNLNSQATEDEAALLNDIIKTAENKDISVTGMMARRQELKKLFAWLLGIGFGLGILIATVLVMAIQKLGLVKNTPYDIQVQPDRPPLEHAQPKPVKQNQETKI